jgi:branched-chain amino acid transport system substrate-binding protein
MVVAPHFSRAVPTPVNHTRRALLALPLAFSLPSIHAQATREPIRLALIEGLSGAFANAGEAVFRNLLWAVERVNARGGVKLPDIAGGARPLVLVRYDSKGNAEEALNLLRAAAEQGASFVLQGNSSATAAALVDAIHKHNQREPDKRLLFLNYSAVDPALTNERCSFWHFRFDAHADMRLAALTDVLRDDRAVQRVYLIGQDYSFGQQVARSARAMLAAKRPELAIVGDELHPLGRVKDFLPYAAKIKAANAQAVLTGNWGNDLTLLVRALREVGSEAKLYTFYGNALGAPAAIGDAGVGRVLAVAEWQPNAGDAASEAFYAAFRQRFPEPRDDYVHVRMQLLVEMLTAAIEKAGGTEAAAVARALEGASFNNRPLGGLHSATMRAADHQLQQPMVVSVMDRAGTPGVKHDVEGSGLGFRTLRRLDADAVAQASTCRMARPD